MLFDYAFLMMSISFISYTIPVTDTFTQFFDAASSLQETFITFATACVSSKGLLAKRVVCGLRRLLSCGFLIPTSQSLHLMAKQGNFNPLIC